MVYADEKLVSATISYETDVILEYDPNGDLYKTFDVRTIASTINDNKINIESIDTVNKTIQITGTIENIPDTNIIWLYGQYVSNFHTIKKDYLYTISVAALQEVDRQQTSDKLRITELETQLSSVLSRLNALEINDVEMINTISYDDLTISTFTRDDYFFKLNIPIGDITIKKADIKHIDITGDYKIKKMDGTLIGIFNGVNVIESNVFVSNGIVKFILYDMNDNILACDVGTVDLVVIV
jgi:hypothetical protein